MSLEATGWAFRQKVPPKPKMVLMALADQTHEKTGRVCYGKTDMAHLADKASVPERSLARYIGALVHNGYIIRESGRDPGGRQRANSYWLVLDRPLSESVKDWKWPGTHVPSEGGDDDPADDPDAQDVVAPDANLAVGETVENDDDRLPHNGSSPSAIGGRRKDSSEVPLEPLPRARAAPVVPTCGFSRKAQDLDRESVAISKAAAKQNAQEFVLEGSRAWIAWCAYRRSRGQIGSLPTCSGVGKFAGRRGWWLPSLFPPQSTEPPSTLSDQDVKDFAESGNR